jgi:hypothetical protein
LKQVAALLRIAAGDIAGTIRTIVVEDAVPADVASTDAEVPIACGSANDLDIGVGALRTIGKVVAD